MRTNCLVVLYLLIGCGSSRAQAPCKPMRDEVDVITKAREITYTTKKRDGHYMVREAEQVHTELLVETAEVVSILEGASITFLFTDDSTMVLTEALGGVAETPIARYYPWRLYTYADLAIPQLEALARKPVKLVRYALRQYDKDVAWSPKEAEAYRSMTACMLATLQP